MEAVTCPSCGTKFYPPRRSTGKYSQNHHFNGHVAQIARERRYDFEYVKLRAKTAAISFGFPPPTEVRVNQGGYSFISVVFKSEADATKPEGAALIEGAHVVAAEEGVALRETEE